MRKRGRGRLINAALSELVTRIGHGQTLVVADAGLPVPPGTRCLDLALAPGIPSFAAVIGVIAEELEVERVLIAEEADRRGPELRSCLREAFGAAAPPVAAIGHEALKERAASALAVVRTGETTPYFNAVLVGGVTF